MAGFSGRTISLTWDSAALAGVREKSVALNGEAIDITSDDDDGWRALLEEPGENQVNLSLSGVSKEDTLRADWFAGDRTKAVVLTYPNGGVLSGDFYLANYTDTGPYNDATTFECELQSTGEVSYTPGSP